MSSIVPHYLKRTFIKNLWCVVCFYMLTVYHCHKSLRSSMTPGSNRKSRKSFWKKQDLCWLFNWSWMKSSQRLWSPSQQHERRLQGKRASDTLKAEVLWELRYGGSNLIKQEERARSQRVERIVYVMGRSVTFHLKTRENHGNGNSERKEDEKRNLHFCL